MVNKLRDVSAAKDELEQSIEILKEVRGRRNLFHSFPLLYHLAFFQVLIRLVCDLYGVIMC